MRRFPMQVDKNFHTKIKKLQEQIMRKKGKFNGIPKITGDIIKMPEWELIEKRLLGEVNQVDFTIKFDGRLK